MTWRTNNADNLYIIIKEIENMTLQEIKEIVACEKLNLFSLIDESLIQNDFMENDFMENDFIENDFMENLIIFDSSNLILLSKESNNDIYKVFKKSLISNHLIKEKKSGFIGKK